MNEATHEMGMGFAAVASPATAAPARHAGGCQPFNPQVEIAALTKRLDNHRDAFNHVLDLLQDHQQQLDLFGDFFEKLAKL